MIIFYLRQSVGMGLIVVVVVDVVLVIVVVGWKIFLLTARKVEISSCSFGTSQLQIDSAIKITNENLINVMIDFGDFFLLKLFLR